METIVKPQQVPTNLWESLVKLGIETITHDNSTFIQLTGQKKGFNDCIRELRHKSSVNLYNPRPFFNVDKLYEFFKSIDEIGIYYNMMSIISDIYTRHLFVHLDLFEDYIFSKKRPRFPEVSTSDFDVVGKTKDGIQVSFKIDENDLIIKFEGSQGNQFIVSYPINIFIE